MTLWKHVVYWVLVVLAFAISLAVASAFPRLTGSPDPEPAPRHTDVTP